MVLTLIGIGGGLLGALWGTWQMVLRGRSDRAREAAQSALRELQKDFKAAQQALTDRRDEAERREGVIDGLKRREEELVGVLRKAGPGVARDLLDRLYGGQKAGTPGPTGGLPPTR